MARQASVSSAPGLGGGRGDRGLLGEAMVVLPFWLGRRRRGAAGFRAAGLVDGVRGRDFGLLCSHSFEWVRVRARRARRDA